MEQKLISISDLIKNGWQLFAKNIQQFVLPIGVLIPVYLILYLLEFFVFPGQTVIYLLVLALSIFMNLWISILLIELINKIYKNQSFNINELFQSSMKKIAIYFLVAILVGLVTMLGFILLIIPGIIFAVWYSFAEFIVVLEDKKGTETLKASKDLVRGRWGATFWRLVLPSLLVYLIGMVIALILTFIFSVGKIDFSSIEQNLIFNAITSLVFIALSPLFTAYGVILYNSLKDTKKAIIQ